MNRGTRLIVAGLFALVLAWIGWTTIAVTRADALAASDPDAALRIEPRNSAAMLRAAKRALVDGDNPAATRLAQRLLATAPGQGEGFAVLAVAAAQQGHAGADALLAVAVRRAARNRGVRARAAVVAMRDGQLSAAMVQLDALLRLGAGTNLYPALAQQAVDPRFAAVLSETLARGPRWRAAFLATLLAKGSPQAVDQVYGELRRRGALSNEETGRWLARMVNDGRWGAAYARWIATLGPLKGSLPIVHEGGFERDPSGIGFDWQKAPKVSGVFTELEPSPGATGSRAAHFRFIGPSAGGDLRQPLLLAPGRYRLQLRARAEFLHTEQGLEWRITCARGPTVATLGPLDGSFEWRTMGVDFSVPPGDCPGQWLELRNPAVRGAAQHASGDLWIDDIVIVPVQAPAGASAGPEPTESHQPFEPSGVPHVGDHAP